MNAQQLVQKIQKDTVKAYPYLSERAVLSIQKERILDWLFMQDESIIQSALKTAQEANAILFRGYHEGFMA